MWRATITNSGKKGSPWIGEFNTEAEANAWVDKMNKIPDAATSSNWYNEEVLTQEQIDDALEERLFEYEEDRYIKQYRFAGSATSVVEDITVEQAARDRLVKLKSDAVNRVRDLQFGQEVIGLVGQMNIDKGLSEAQINSLTSDATVATIISLLLVGRISPARALVDGYTVDGVTLTAQDKSDILLLLDDYLNYERS